MNANDRIIDDLMGRLTLEQKVGQMFTQAFYGTILTPDLRRTVTRLNCGGLRITQHFRGFRRYARAGEKAEAFERVSPADLTGNLIDDRKDLLCKSPYMDVEQYARLLADVKAVADDRPYDIPLHMMLDCEADGGDCVRGGTLHLPYPFGYARLGNAQLVYDVCKALGIELTAIGFNMINSPVVDICFDPTSTYIRTRAFGTTVEHVCAMASAALRGFTDGGIIACAKHFPGRGATDVDAHHDVGAIDKSAEALWEEDLAPYRRLIAEGLGAIMVGHSIYPAWDGDNLASVSDAIINGILRGRLGFEGMVCTDSMIMGAIAKKYGVPRACMLSIRAGASAILMKECGPIREEAIRLTMEAVKAGEITEAHLDALMVKNLRTKLAGGLFGPAYRHDAARAEAIVHAPELRDVERRAAEEAVHVVRDEAGLLPLPAAARVLLVEEVPRQYLNANDPWMHPGQFWEEILPHSPNVSLVEIEENATDADVEKVRAYMDFYDLFVVTYYKNKNVLSSAKVIDMLRGAGKAVVVVSATPLPCELPSEWPTVVCTYGIGRAPLRTAAAVLYGAFEPKG
ncbi:MAG: hypothetical protein GX591_14440 [Planctomycetes bacterium]|nr:hypothetical protein [Planctomycetota bacterium]